MDTNLIIAKGKTKTLFQFTKKNSDLVLVRNSDDITAGDGARHTNINIHGKGELVTRITCNVFELLKRRQMPCAYVGRIEPNAFLAHKCTMIPVKVVMRGYQEDSYLKRDKNAIRGIRFETPVVEFFLKTNNRSFNDMNTTYNDPLMEYDINGLKWYLYAPDQPRASSARVGVSWSPEYAHAMYKNLSECKRIAQKIYECIEWAWRKHGGILHDIKFEFGIKADGEIVLADVIDCDSWRVLWNKMQLSKQGYRDGDSAEEVLEVYKITASITDHFPDLL